MSGAHDGEGTVNGPGQELDERNVLVRALVRILVWIRSSFIAFVGAIGTTFLLSGLLVSGLVVPSLEYGVVAAMCIVWAVSAYVYAVGGYFGLKLINYN